MASTVKRSITLDRDLDIELKQRFAPGELSRFLNDAARDALARRRIAELLDEMEAADSIPDDVRQALLREIRDLPRPQVSLRSARVVERVTLVLDADGLTKLARRDRRVLLRLREEVVVLGSRLVIPYVIVVQAFAESGSTGAVERILDDAHELAPIDRQRARHAASLLQRTGTTDVPDALVAVEALRNVPSIVITSDRIDIRRLLDADDVGHRVVVWPV